MKILIVTSYSGSWPYVPELLEELKKRGGHTEVFDIDDLGPLGLAAKIAFNVPKLRYPVSVALLRRRLARLPTDFDVVNIHFVYPVYRYLASSLKRRSGKLVTTIWGSDFLRASPSDLRALGQTLSASDVVTTNNSEILQRLVAHYPEIRERVRVVRWGLRSLDVITALQCSESQEQVRRKLELPVDRTIVTCGYNGGRHQQHAMMIDALARMKPAMKARVFALFPMTYATKPEYRREIAALLDSSNVQYRILDNQLSLENVCRLRIASDYALNVQTTDSLSASIQEHMFAGSRMVVGKWLPYSVFEKIGVPLRKVATAEEICAALESTLDTAAERSRPTYADRIYELASWSSNIGKWLEVYQ